MLWPSLAYFTTVVIRPDVLDFAAARAAPLPLCRSHEIAIVVKLINRGATYIKSPGPDLAAIRTA
jgi:hypothetical protein